jgi:hypothetical protein
VRRSFEPAAPPDPAALAAAADIVTGLYQDMLDDLHPLLTQEDQ